MSLYESQGHLLLSVTLIPHLKKDKAELHKGSEKGRKGDQS